MGNTMKKGNVPSPSKLTIEEIQVRNKLFVCYSIKLFKPTLDLHIHNYSGPINSSDGSNPSTITNNLLLEASSELLKKVPLVGQDLGLVLRKGAEAYQILQKIKKSEKIVEIFGAIHEDPVAENRLLIKVFHQIFQNFNIQFGQILKKPTNNLSLRKLMMTIAREVVMRIFHYLEECSETTRPKDMEKLLFTAFLEGGSKNSRLAQRFDDISEKISSTLRPDTDRKIQTIYGELGICEVFDGADILHSVGHIQKVVKKTEIQSLYLFRYAIQSVESLTDQYLPNTCVPKKDYKMPSEFEDYFEELGEPPSISDVVEENDSDKEYLKHELQNILQSYIANEIKEQLTNTEIAIIANQNKNQIILRKEISNLNKERGACITCLGNPGFGKSFLLNCLAEEELFKSGPSFNGGLTKIFTEGKNKIGTIFYDSPGLAETDQDKVDAAGRQISIGLKRGGRLKIIFICGTALNGRPNAADATTMGLIIESAPEIGNSYGVIVNQVTPTDLNYISNPNEPHCSKFLTEQFCNIPEANKPKLGNVLFIQRHEEFSHMKLVDPDSFRTFCPNQTHLGGIGSNPSLIDFVNHLPEVNITEGQVTDIKTSILNDMRKLIQQAQGFQKDLKNAQRDNVELINALEAKIADIQNKIRKLLNRKCKKRVKGNSLMTSTPR